ncbi:MAG: phosphoribosylanthranilate isomerase [Rhodospirillaceae bacterium]|nr:MAG: phosphoribosylanthranilate isomerase [Rhodospirillaceae bacterium]
MTTARGLVKVKICGLNDRRGLDAALDAGAAYVGFVFYRRSPRFVDLDQAAALVARVPRPVIAVGLFVDPTDADITMVTDRVGLGMLQLHGNEAPERVDEIKRRTGLPAMKVLGVASAGDVHRARAYEDRADMLMFDARPPPGATRPGGNAVAFDWKLVRSYTGPVPWMLAGGLTRDNVATAIAQSGATIVDVSSGVESNPGVKSPAKIRAFLAAVAAARLG